jgi:hypothetical protein
MARSNSPSEPVEHCVTSRVLKFGRLRVLSPEDRTGRQCRMAPRYRHSRGRLPLQGSGLGPGNPQVSADSTARRPGPGCPPRQRGGSATTARSIAAASSAERASSSVPAAWVGFSCRAPGGSAGRAARRRSRPPRGCARSARYPDAQRKRASCVVGEGGGRRCVVERVFHHGGTEGTEGSRDTEGSRHRSQQQSLLLFSVAVLRALCASVVHRGLPADAPASGVRLNTGETAGAPTRGRPASRGGATMKLVDSSRLMPHTYYNPSRKVSCRLPSPSASWT